MSRNFFKIAFRNLWVHKTFSLINLVGLAIGMSACFLIYIYVSYESGYDTYHTKADRIYRLAVYDDRPSENHYSSGSPAMGAAIMREYPEIAAMARINFYSFLIANGMNKFQEDNVMFADSSVFSIFSFPFLRGNPNSALKDPFSVVLSETAAKKYFGSADPMGQTLALDWPDFGKYQVKITGVMQDIPDNSQFKSDIILSMTTMTKSLAPVLEECWFCPRGPTYFLLPEGNDPQQLESKLPYFLKKYADKVKTDGRDHLTLSLEPLKRIYLHGKYPSPKSGNIYNVYIFSVIAVFILLIAGINFINLTTARSVERAKEVGIRRVMGSSKIQLIGQFIGESLLLCLLAFLFACLLCILFLPVFNRLCDSKISDGFYAHSFVFLLIALFIGFAAGVYPAFVLSSFRPASALKGHLVAAKYEITLRQILVVVQFAVSIVLIIGTIVVYLQLNHIRNQPLGFKKDQMLVIDFHRDSLIKEQMEAIKHELTKLPHVLSASASSGIPNSGFVNEDYEIENRSGTMQHEKIALYMIDEDYFRQYQIQVLAGRTFSKNYTTDFDKTLVMNEAALNKFGYRSPDEAIGKRFSGEGGGTVIGVVKNFNFRSLHTDIAPLIFRNSYLATRYLTLNIASSNVPAAIDAIQRKWNELEPQRPFNYFFLDEAIDKQYRSETNFGKLFLYFGTLAIFISSLGLFGLTLFSTYQRSKEIGIRKIVGASVGSIVHLLTKDFLRLVIIAFIIAAPVAWYGMNTWLQEFAYRIDISWWIFVAGGLTALLIALFTVSFQAIKAAIGNPVKSLRSE